jgi:signal transduction histidine kinase
MAQPNGDKLAELYTLIQLAATRSGRALHDDLGPLLSAAGLHLQMLRMDHPRMGSEIDQIAAILEQAFERIRDVSRELAPSPVLRGGLKSALEWLAESTAASHPGIAVKLNYKITADLPVIAACALYEATGAAVAEAVGPFGATRVAIAARGALLGPRKVGLVSIRVEDNGRARGRAKALRAACRIAEAQGLSMTLATKQDTIVLIRYALRPPTGG